MTTPAAIEVHITAFKTVKTQGVFRIEIDIPLENMREFSNHFNISEKATLVNVIPEMLTINEAATRSAELKEALKASVAELDNPPEKPKGGPLAKRAGIMSGEVAFIGFMEERFNTSIDPAHFVRNFCGVESRAQLDHNSEAARMFRDLEAQYNAWLKVTA